MSNFEQLVSAIYNGIEHPADWQSALELLVRNTGSRAGGLFVVANGRLHYDIDVGMPAEFMHGFRLNAAADPRLHYAAQRPRHSVVSDDVAELRPAIEAAGLDRITQQFDLDYTSATILSCADASLPVLYLSRSARQGPLPGQHAELLSRVAPHFARALRLRAELIRAREVLGGGMPVTLASQPLAGDTLHASCASAPTNAEGSVLPRQLRRVLERIAAGDSNAEIARRLHVSVNTVRTHVRRLLDLSGTCRRTALLRVAAQRGWRF